MKKTSILRLGALIAVAALLSPAFIPFASVQASSESWQKGVSIESEYAEDFSSDGFKQSVRNAKDMGVTHISLVIPYYQASKEASDMGPGWNTPSDETLISAIDYIHSLGLSVVLKPHLEIYGGEWRGLIQASDRDAWYTNYGNLVNHLADIGQTHGAEEFIVGSELIGMASSYRDYNNTERWEKIISDVRARYSGLVTYSANWGNGYNYVNEWEYIKFWGSLDYIGISAYFEHWNDGSISSLVESWRSIDQNQISKIQQEYGKPILFTEIGYRSVDNAHNQPWNSGMPGNYNAEEQVRDMEALFQYWDTRDYFAGVLIWNWESNPDTGGQGNTDYTPNNKPAEDTIRNWFTKGGTPTPPPPPPPPPEPTGSWGSAASGATSVSPGQPNEFSVQVSNSGEASNIITDIEIYDSLQRKVFQQFFENQTFTPNAPLSYNVVFTPPDTGTYRLKVGVFNSTWSTNYFWNEYAHEFIAGTQSPTNPQEEPEPDPTDPNPEPSTFETDIWWPTDGTPISGVQPFKAMVQDKAVSEYTMYWQVDGDRLNEMQNSDVDYPHKEVMVDLSGWNWRGTGPYLITFVSKDPSGNIISQKTVSITVVP